MLYFEKRKYNSLRIKCLIFDIYIKNKTFNIDHLI